jgi:hypothetical protein
VALYSGYFLLLRRLVSRMAEAKWTLRVLLVLEVIETILLWTGSILLSRKQVPGLFRGVLAFVASAKWVTGAVLVLVILINDELRGAVAKGALRLFRAVWEQRLSFVVVAILGVLSLVPGPHMWDQLPDVERSWFDRDPEDGSHWVWAAIGTVVVALYLFVVGRLRSERVWAARVYDARADEQRDHQQQPPAPPDPVERAEGWRKAWEWLKPRVWWWWWLLPPLVLVAAGMLLERLPLDGLVDWQNVGWAAAVPIAILILSGLVTLYYGLHGWLSARVPGWGPRWWRRWLGTKRSLWEPPPLHENGGQRRRGLDVWVAGDVLAVAVVVIGGLGLVRSLIAPVLLGALGGGGSDIWTKRLVVLLVGVIVALSAFPLAAAWLRGLDTKRLPREVDKAPVKRLLRPSDNRRARGWLRSVLALALWIAAIVALVALMVWPLRIGRALGVVATTIAALGAWAAVLGFLIVLLQYRQPLPLFRALRMRSTPVLTLLLVAPLLASLGGGDPDLHALSPPPGGPPAAVPDRPSLREAFAQWLGGSQACDRPIDATDDQKVRPMVLVAASGGGIRAAVWTAAVLDQLGDGGPCASRAVFLSSGISGGSVGLALSRGQHPMRDAKELAGPNALAAGIAGTLVGDLIAGSTGLRIPSRSLVDEDGQEPAGRPRWWGWRDRAGLMEAVWEAKAASLGARDNQAPSGPAGMLVLNSAAAGRGCRVLVSQVELATAARETAARAAGPKGTESFRLASCQGRTNQPAASLDLQDLYGDCTPDMSWATAAMLSARFPWILPGGRVPPQERVLPSGTKDCAGQPNLQLIDGGHAEGSGIGTLADIAPALLQVVRDHNATRDGGQPYVVPVVMYLEDETRKDIVRQPQGLSPELFVPLAGRNAGAVQISSGTWLQRVADNIANPCPARDRQRCLDAVNAVQGQLSGGVVIAAPTTKPSIEAPLGWTLSEDSRNELEQAAKAQANGCRTLPPDGYPCLRQLLNVLKPVRT